jgi:hypothetical protein
VSARRSLEVWTRIFRSTFSLGGCRSSPSLDAYAARAMTQPFSDRTARVTLLALVAVALLVLASHVTRLDPRLTSTQIQWRSIGQWEVGWKPLVFCSAQTAALRGWRADLGPLVVTHLRAAFAIPRIVQPDAAANTSQPFRAETNRTSEAAASHRSP